MPIMLCIVIFAFAAKHLTFSAVVYLLNIFFVMAINLSLAEQSEILLVLHKRIKSLDVVISNTKSLGLSPERYELLREICLSAFEKISVLSCID